MCNLTWPEKVNLCTPLLIFSITLWELKLQGIKIRDVDIRRLNVSPVILVFFVHKTKCLYSSVVERRTCDQKVGGMNPSVGNHSTHVYHSLVLLSGIKHLFGTSFSGFKFFLRILQTLIPMNSFVLWGITA